MKHRWYDNRALCSLAIGACLILPSACAKAHAKTAPDAPLDMPAPPPRDVEPAEPEASPPGVPLIAEPARNLPPRPARPAPPPPREAPKPETAKPEPPKPETAPEPRPADEPAHPPTTLQTTPTTAEGDLERGVRATLTRATNELNRIDYRGLNTDARTQYDTAKRFIRQADDAMKSKNLVFAKNLADKAAAIAAQLVVR
jgi:outer membrane biosynthesis protein TonB